MRFHKVATKFIANVHFPKPIDLLTSLLDLQIAASLLKEGFYAFRKRTKNK